MTSAHTNGMRLLAHWDQAATRRVLLDEVLDALCVNNTKSRMERVHFHGALPESAMWTSTVKGTCLPLRRCL